LNPGCSGWPKITSSITWKNFPASGRRFTHIARHDESAAQNIYDQLQDAQYQKLLREAIGTLPEKQKQVFELARHHNLSYLQIAEKLQISSLTVKTHMSRALQHIRNFFHQEGIIFLLCLLAATFF
jgi:RNA polymerase sigma-70 factor (ECF subfamily)